MYQAVAVVEVRIWNRLVGAVALDPKLGYYAFEYDPAFVRSGIELAPLAMPLSAATEPFVFTALPAPTYQRLPAMLADALPDDFGNSLIDAWMASRGVAKGAITPLDRLAYMGKRGLGALQFRPTRGPQPRTSTALELSTLVESARRAVQGEFASESTANAALAQLIRVGTSAGGARAKAVISWNPHTGKMHADLSEAEPGFEHWILKFDGIGKDRELGGSHGYGRIEFAYFRMATSAGIAMNPCRLLEENGRAHFMTRRFDRSGDEKLHLQSLCALRHLDYKQKATHDYSQFLQTILDIGLGHDALEQAFRRMAFNVMARNCDDHTKNFAFLLPEDGAWRLAPAYDLTFAYNPRGDWTYQHLMSVNNKFANITRDDLLKVADRFGIGSAAHLMTAVHDAVAAWPEFAGEAALPNTEITRIGDHHRLL